MYLANNFGNGNAVANKFPTFQHSLRGQDLFVILGSQGSGTNLLCTLLRQVFNFSVVQDRSLILTSAVRIDKNPAQSQIKKEIDHVYRSLFPNSVRKRFNLKHYYHQAKNYTGIEKYLRDSEIHNAKEFVDFFYDYHAFVVGGKHKAIKSDDISDHMSGLNEKIIPKKKYILLLRDPRDNAISIVNKPFGPCHLYFASLFVKEKMLLHEQETQRNPESTFVINYETILSKPEKFVKSFSERFNLEPIGDLSKLSIRKENFNKWALLPRQDLEMCETVLKDEILRFGYTLKTKGNFKFSHKDVLLWRLNELSKHIVQRSNAQIKNFLKP